MEESIKFYDSLFEQTELNKVFSTERMTFWQREDIAFAIVKPFNCKPDSNGNGTMIGLNVGSTEEVKRLHSKTIELGVTCEGGPGQRGPKFPAYARDLDMNKIVFPYKKAYQAKAVSLFGPDALARLHFRCVCRRGSN